MPLRMDVQHLLRRIQERDVTPDFDSFDPARRGNRRRLRVFIAAFLVSLLLGQAWNLLRPAVYRASARIQIAPSGNAPLTQMTPGASGSLAEVTAPTTGAVTSGALLDEIQRLSSRPLLEKVRQRMDASGRTVTDGDAVGELQRMINVSPLPGSGVIQLFATGAAPESLASTLNTLIEVYRDELAAAHASRSDEDLTQARDELARLERNVAGKRAELEAFRVSHGVVSSERDENETLARIKGLATSLNTANEKLAIAEAQLRSLRAAAESGKNVVQAKDNPTLAAIEQRASKTREDLRDMERTYTADFMAMDPQAQALRASLAELEKQIVDTRASGLQSAILAAESEVDSDRATVARLKQQLTAERQGAQGFLSSFSQAKELENDLAQIDVVRRTAVERLAKLEASERGLRPVLGVVEMAAIPQSPWQPHYLRDGLLILPGAFLLGLLSMWFVELFNRSPYTSTPTSVVLPQSLMIDHGERRYMAGQDAMPSLLQNPQALALSQFVLPRELSQDQVSALLAAGNRDGRLVCVALLLGLGVDEICTLQIRNVDRLTGRLRVEGAAARDIDLPAWFAESLTAQATAEADKPLLHDAAGARLSGADIEVLISAAAHDAGMEAAEDVTPEVLRHTGIAWLVRCGVRYSDLGGRVGRLSAEHLAAYAKLAPDIPRGGANLVVPVMPALAGNPED